MPSPLATPVTEPSLLATFQVAETIDSFNASNFTLQLAQASGVAASAITLNIMSGSLTVTASFYISSADRSRVQDTLDQQASSLSAMLGVTVLSTPTIQLVEPQPLPNVGDSAAALLTLDGALPSSPTLLMIALILAGVANVACAIGCTMYVVLRRRRIRRAKERFGAAAERAAQKKHSLDIEMTNHPSAAIAASHLVQPVQRLLSQPPSAATADAPLPSPRARRPVQEPPPPSPPGFKLEAKPVPSAEAAATPVAAESAAAGPVAKLTLPVLDLKLSELKGRDPDAPMATPRKDAPDSSRRKKVEPLRRSSARSPSPLPPLQPPHNIDLWKHLRRGRTSETPETPSSMGGNHSRSEAIRGTQTPSSVGVATMHVMSNVTTPDNSTADVTA